MQSIRFTGARSARSTVAVRGSGAVVTGAILLVSEELARRLLGTGDFEDVALIKQVQVVVEPAEPAPPPEPAVPEIEPEDEPAVPAEGREGEPEDAR